MLKTIVTLALLAAPAAPAVAAQTGTGAPASRGQLPPPPPKPMPGAQVGPGRLEGPSYTHEYFGISFDVPQDWVMQGAEEKDAIMDEGRRMTEGAADGVRRAQLESAARRTNFLLSLFKHPPERPAEDFNAHLAFMVERVPSAVVKTGADYMNLSLMTLKSTSVKVEVVGPVRAETLGGVTFAAADVRMTLPAGVAAQKYYTTVRRGYALVFIYSYADEADLKTFEGVLKSVKFK